MDTTLTLDTPSVSDAAHLAFLPFAATQAFVGAGVGLLASGWLAARAITNAIAVASGAAGVAGAMSAFRSHAGDGIAANIGETSTLAASETIAASERLAEASGAHLQVSPAAQAAAEAQGQTPSDDQLGDARWSSS